VEGTSALATSKRRVFEFFDLRPLAFYLDTLFHKHWGGNYANTAYGKGHAFLELWRQRHFGDMDEGGIAAALFRRYQRARDTKHEEQFLK